MRVTLEDLVTRPRPICAQICATLGVPFEEALLTPYAGDRMREGPRGARAVGDPGMAAHGRIAPELVNRWRDAFDPDSLSAATWALATALGYERLPPGR